MFSPENVSTGIGVENRSIMAAVRLGVKSATGPAGTFRPLALSRIFDVSSHAGERNRTTVERA